MWGTRYSTPEVGMGDSQVAEEELNSMAGKSSLGNSVTMNTGTPANWYLPEAFLLPSLVQIRPRWHPQKSSLKRVSLSESLGQENGEGQRLFLSLLFPNKQLTINTPKHSSRVTKLWSLHYPIIKSPL